MVFNHYLGKRYIKTAKVNIVTLNKLPNASSKVQLKKHLHLRGKFFDQLMRSLKDILLTVCQERNDAWATSVQARIVSAHDMHTVDTVYHIVIFRTMRQIPAGYKNKGVLDDMKGQSVVEYTFRRKSQMINMDRNSTVTIDGNAVQIDPQLLLRTLAAKSAHDL